VINSCAVLLVGYNGTFCASCRRRKLKPELLIVELDEAKIDTIFDTPLLYWIFQLYLQDTFLMKVARNILQLKSY